MGQTPSYYMPPEWGEGLRLECHDSHGGRFQVDDKEQVFTGGGRYDMTQFFRYPEIYEEIGRILQRHGPKTKRLLSLPASIGCEAYSLAAIFRRHAEPGQNLEIHMADISEAKLRAAQTGVYPYGFHGAVCHTDYREYFQGIGGSPMRVRNDIKNMVKALPAFNVTDAPPMAVRYDVIVCFNMLCYLPDQESKVQAVRYLAGLLTDEGTLCLSHGAYKDFAQNHEAVTEALKQEDLRETRCFQELAGQPQNPPYKVVRFFERPPAPSNDL